MLFSAVVAKMNEIYGDIGVALSLFMLTHNWPQRALYHNFQMAITSWFYVCYFYTASLYLYNLLMISCVYSILHFSVDTLDILFRQRKLNWMVLHHVIGVYILVVHLIVQQNLQLMATLAFTLESSAMFYNLYYYRYIPKWFHLLFYLPLRIAANYIILTIVWQTSNKNQIVNTLNLINYFLLFLFNTVCIFTGFMFYIRRLCYCQSSKHVNRENKINIEF